MFFGSILPCLFTIGILLVFVIWTTSRAPEKQISRREAYKSSRLKAILAFIPLFAVITALLYPIRFGPTYPHRSQSTILDLRVRNCTPNQISKIKLNRDPYRFEAKYQVSRPELERWYAEFLQDKNDEWPNGTLQSQSFESTFSHQNWDHPTDLREFGGYETASGFNFFIWYSESTGTAFQTCFYSW